MSGRHTSIIAASLLWGVFFIKVPLLLLAGMVLAVAAFVLSVREGAGVEKLTLLLLLNLAYWLLNGLVTGGLKPAMLVNPQYLMAEGRGFLYYLPLLTLSAALVGNRQLENVVRVVWAMGIAALILFFIWLPFRPGMLSGGPVGNFYGFVTSHTGAGTFFAILAAFLAVYGHRTGHKAMVYLGFLLALPVFGSASRQALVGLLAVLAWYVIRLGRARYLGYATVVTVVLVATMPVLTPHTWERTAGLFNRETVDAVVTTLEQSNWEPGLTLEVEGKQYNVLARFLYWEYTIKQFASSPLVGNGFGRFNDTEAEYVGRKGTVWIAAKGPASPIQLQAHNSYLHFLAELGILGLAMLLWLWYEMYRELRKAEQCLAPAHDLSAYFTACQGLIIFVFACSLFGHAFASPIIGIPVLTIIAVGLGFRRRLVCRPLTSEKAILGSNA